MPTRVPDPVNILRVQRVPSEVVGYPVCYLLYAPAQILHAALKHVRLGDLDLTSSMNRSIASLHTRRAVRDGAREETSRRLSHSMPAPSASTYFACATRTTASRNSNRTSAGNVHVHERAFFRELAQRTDSPRSAFIVATFFPNSSRSSMLHTCA